jgi:hypothetical protein
MYYPGFQKLQVLLVAHNFLIRCFYHTSSVTISHATVRKIIYKTWLSRGGGGLDLRHVNTTSVIVHQRTYTPDNIETTQTPMSPKLLQLSVLCTLFLVFHESLAQYIPSEWNATTPCIASLSSPSPALQLILFQKTCFNLNILPLYYSDSILYMCQTQALDAQRCCSRQLCAKTEFETAWKYLRQVNDACVSHHVYPSYALSFENFTDVPCAEGNYRTSNTT